MLLSDSAEKEFNKAKYDFLRDENHKLTLEFEANGKKQFIQRSFSANNTICFGNSPTVWKNMKNPSCLKSYPDYYFRLQTMKYI